jgi:hypothetical protein
MLPRPPRDRSNGVVPTGPDSRLVILAENVGKGRGHIAVFLGCSTKVTLPTSMMLQSSGVPTKVRLFRGGH